MKNAVFRYFYSLLYKFVIMTFGEFIGNVTAILNIRYSERGFTSSA